MSRSVEVLAINRTEGLAVCHPLGLGDIRCYLDTDGEETDLDLAVFATIEWRSGGWTTVMLSDYPERQDAQVQ